MRTQAEKGSAFAALHAAEPFIIPNPWDAGSARMLEAHGFKALATTSSGFAFTLGRLDGRVTLDEVMIHVAALTAASDLPVSVDMENGYGSDPQSAATAVRRAAEAGAVGGSIEDWDPSGRLYDLDHAVARIEAAAEAAHSLKFPFTLTARAENHIRGNPDLDDTIERLRAYEAAGADVLYAPGLRDLATMRTVVQSIGKPLNVVMSAADPSLTAAEMEAVGVKRLSVGGALSRLALSAFMKGAREMKEKGTFTWVRDAVPTTDLKAVFRA